MCLVQNVFCYSLVELFHMSMYREPCYSVGLSLDDIEGVLHTYAITMDPGNYEDMKNMVNSALGTKFNRYGR